SSGTDTPQQGGRTSDLTARGLQRREKTETPEQVTRRLERQAADAVRRWRSDRGLPTGFGDPYARDPAPPAPGRAILDARGRCARTEPAHEGRTLVPRGASGSGRFCPLPEEVESADFTPSPVGDATDE